MHIARPAHRPVARRALLTGFALSAAALAGCASQRREGRAPATAAAESLLAAHGLQDRDARSVIDQLEALPLAERPAGLMAAVMPEALVLTDADGSEASLPLPSGESYVSVAPFVETTHDCFFHSLTTCLGELQEQDVEVLVTAADGTVILDEVRTTAPNGFLGLWLPRDRELTLTVSLDGAVATASLSTHPDSATCITTMQLTA